MSRAHHQRNASRVRGDAVLPRAAQGMQTAS
jgi:hypothetical protein